MRKMYLIKNFVIVKGIVVYVFCLMEIMTTHDFLHVSLDDDGVYTPKVVVTILNANK